MTIKILIADDHHVVRRGLVFFLRTQEGLEIVGEAGNGEEALVMAKELQPDLVLMDLVMPVMDGVEATRRLRQACPEIKVLILTSFSEEEHVIPAIKAGASGYQLKDVAPDDLVAAIRKIYAGEHQLSSQATAYLLRSVAGKGSREEQLASHLTKREKDVLREISSGKSNKDIAKSLFITERTVKTHVSNLLAKLELADRTQAALFAVRHRLDKRSHSE